MLPSSDFYFYMQLFFPQNFYYGTSHLAKQRPLSVFNKMNNENPIMILIDITIISQMSDIPRHEFVGSGFILTWTL